MIDEYKQPTHMQNTGATNLSDGLFVLPICFLQLTLKNDSRFVGNANTKNNDL